MFNSKNEKHALLLFWIQLVAIAAVAAIFFKCCKIVLDNFKINLSGSDTIGFRVSSILYSLQSSRSKNFEF